MEHASLRAFSFQRHTLLSPTTQIILALPVSWHIRCCSESCHSPCALLPLHTLFSLTLENVRSDLLHKYQSKDDILILTVRVAVIVAVILTVPVLFFTVSKASVSSEKCWGLSFPSVSGARSRESLLQVAFLCHWNYLREDSAGRKWDQWYGVDSGGRNLNSNWSVPRCLFVFLIEKCR